MSQRMLKGGGGAQKRMGRKFRESFCESEEGVRFPRETADIRGSPGNLREVWETSGEPLDCYSVPQ